jgi:hypothetical protein
MLAMSGTRKIATHYLDIFGGSPSRLMSGQDVVSTDKPSPVYRSMYIIAKMGRRVMVMSGALARRGKLH